MVQDDGLRDMIRNRQHYVSNVIVQSAQLIADKIDRHGFEAGFDWCTQVCGRPCIHSACLTCTGAGVCLEGWDACSTSPMDEINQVLTLWKQLQEP